ncbi:MAG: hypothetical protein K940chlam2_00997 [Chlamydiae bacterium]|nr:hypothetical protein [Chlamydiota bacterium]
MTTQPPLWMQRVHTALEQLKEIPIWGTTLEFPWESLGARLSEEFGISSIEVRSRKTEYLDGKQALSGLGEDPHILTLSLAPLPGEVFWIFPRKDLAALLAFMTSEEKKSLSDGPRAEGFYTFAALKTLAAINDIQALEDLRASMATAAEIPEEGGFTLDVSIAVKGHTFWGRLLLPSLTHSAFNNHFATQKTLTFTEKTKATPLTLKLEVGSTTLRQNQVTSIAAGDFVILDRCSYDPQAGRGTGNLVLGATPLFDVRLKGDETKLLEYAVFQEEEAMTDDIPIPDEKLPETPPPLENIDGEAPLWSAKNGENGEVKDLIGKDSIPMTLTVEVGKIQMPLEKVLQLEPGNVLEIGMNPGLGVYLTAGGKRIAKGELIKLGESLGVKVLTVGN